MAREINNPVNRYCTQISGSLGNNRAPSCPPIKLPTPSSNPGSQSTLPAIACCVTPTLEIKTIAPKLILIDALSDSPKNAFCNGTITMPPPTPNKWFAKPF